MAQLTLRLAFAVAVVVWGWETPPFQQLVTGVAGGVLLLTAVKPQGRLAVLLDVLAVSTLQVYSPLWLPLSAWAIAVHRRVARSAACLLIPAPFIHAWLVNGDFVWWAPLFAMVWLYLGFTLAESEAEDDDHFLLPLPDELREQWEQEREAHRQLRFQYQELVSAHREQTAQRQMERCRQQILQIALTARDLHDAAHHIVFTLKEYTGAGEGALWVYDEAHSCLRLAHASDMQMVPAVIDLHVPRNMKGARYLQTMTEAFRKALPASLPVLALLLHDDRGIAGAIALADWGSGEETPVRDRVQPLRDALTLAIRRVQEYQTLRQENRTLNALYETSRLLAEGLSVQDSAQQFISLVANLLSAPFVTLYLRDSESGRFEVAGAIGDPIRLSDEKGSEGQVEVAELVAQRNEPLCLPNTSSAPGLIRSASKRIFASLMGVPLNARGRVEGVLLAAHPKPGYFEEYHLQQMTAVAGQFAQVLEVSRITRSVGLLALTDGLTGLFNRRYLELRLEEEIRRSERYGKRFSLLLMDVDHFKQINDRWGHATGDTVLREVGRLLVENLRETEMVFRYGGEEFLVILPETPLHQATQTAQRIRQLVEQHPFRSLGSASVFRVTVSVGVAEYPTHGVDKLSLLTAADDALYAAKQQGRNRIELPPAA